MPRSEARLSTSSRNAGRSARGETAGVGKALDELAAGEADALITTKLDRVARNLRDFLTLDERARAKGWSLVVLDLDFDSSNATSRLIRNVLAGTAEWKREIIGERTTEALAAKRDAEPDWRPADQSRSIRRPRLASSHYAPTA